MNTLTTYYWGYGLSLAFTLVAALLVWLAPLPRGVLTTMVALLALLQAAVQLYFFLHVGREKRPYKDTGALALTLVIIFIVVGGTLWIMSNLEHGESQPFENGLVSPQTEL